MRIILCHYSLVVLLNSDGSSSTELEPLTFVFSSLIPLSHLTLLFNERVIKKSFISWLHNAAQSFS